MILVENSHKNQRLIKSLVPTLTVPVIALTDNDPDVRSAFYKLGVVETVLKPIVCYELLFRIRSVSLTRCLTKPSEEILRLEPGNGSVPGGSTASEILARRTCVFLASRLHMHLSLGEIAREVGSNRTALSSCFKQEVGKSVFCWLREQRMLKARQRLLQTDQSIQRIAMDVGYENSANFSTAYRRQFGLSPRKQRKEFTQANVFLTESKDISTQLN